MKWPWVSRERHITAIRRMAGYVQALTRENDDLRKASAQMCDKLELSQASERAERLKRLRAEGLAAFKDDRIRGALQLLYREESGVKKAG